MKTEIHSQPEVDAVFNQYPKQVRPKMMKLRQLVIEAANEAKGVSKVEETLKWGEPSYVTPHGSTIRMDWKEKLPEQYAIYFSCTSRLVPTFRLIYDDLFSFEGKRAIVFKMDEKLPEEELKRCITAGLTYHKVKALPTLGL